MSVRLPAAEAATLRLSHSRSHSLGGGREVSWDELGELGLHRALKEYYQLAERLPDQMSAPPPRRSTLGALLHATVVRPLPCWLTPEALAAVAACCAYLSALLVYHSAVLTVPAALWLLAWAAGGGAAPMQLPVALAAALPLRVRGSLAEAAPPSLAAACTAVGALALVVRLSEVIVVGRQRRRAEARAKLLTPEQVERSYSGASWLASGGGGNGSVMDSTASAAGLASLRAEVATLWSLISGEPEAQEEDPGQDVVAEISRLCTETGAAPPTSPHLPELRAALGRVRGAVGLS